MHHCNCCSVATVPHAQLRAPVAGPLPCNGQREGSAGAAPGPGPAAPPEITGGFGVPASPPPRELGTGLGVERPCSLLPPRGVLARLTQAACALQPPPPGPRTKASHGHPPARLGPAPATPLPRPSPVGAGTRTGSIRRSPRAAAFPSSVGSDCACSEAPPREGRRGARAAGVRGGGTGEEGAERSAHVRGSVPAAHALVGGGGSGAGVAVYPQGGGGR